MLLVLTSNIRLIDMPDGASIPLALGSQLICEGGGKPSFPIPHRLMSEFQAAAFQQSFAFIASWHEPLAPIHRLTESGKCYGSGVLSTT